MNFRIGQGYDVHRLTSGRALIIGGVRIEHELGLAGHSDADVLLHAITDACLGALSLGDIGSWFPDTDPQFKGADSRVLLRRVVEEISGRGFHVVNLDATVIAQAPRLAPYTRRMRANIATDCGIEPEQVSVKATTTERLGLCGRGEGMAATACVLLIGEQNV